MDSGAHYFSWDFQVHSPRDRDWTGPTPTNDEERNAYADRFVKACRSVNLNAVAITDHHDIVFVEYIRTAAERETSEGGDPVPPDERLIVFPGVELTLALPCQALLIFDPGCSQTELHAALAILGIVSSAAAEAKTCETQRLSADITPSRICESLSNNASLNGRFILLPNVNDGGGDTMLRSGFAMHYIDMPCVGGYVDGSMTGHGRHLIISGKDPQWGSKKIGVFQTSDNRRDDFANLGKHRTWVKWSKPTAEALRQACLAPTSRLSYVEPSLPHSWIKRMKVSASRYFGPLDSELNPQTNMAIGGRGSGKSTLLEYLRWGLCDQPVSTSDDGSEEVPNYERRRGSLIHSTLQRSHGTVTIEYMINGVLHTIRRDANTEKVFPAIDNAAEEEVTPAIIQGLAQLQGYSQKQLSNVSVRNSELLRLVTSPLKSDLDLLEASAQECASRLRSCFQAKETHRTLSAQLLSTTTELTSKKSQLRTLQAEIGILAPEHKLAIEEHASYSKGQRIAEEYATTFDSLIFDLDALAKKVDQRKTGVRIVDGSEPSIFLTSLRDTLLVALESTRTEVLAAKDAATVAKDSATALQDQLKNSLEDHAGRYTAATSQNAAIQSRLDQMKASSVEVESLTTVLDGLNWRLAELGSVDQNLQDARQAWKEIAEKEFSLLATQATSLTAAAKGELRVSVNKGKDVNQLIENLASAIQGANVTRDKISRLVETVPISNQPFDEWISIIDEIMSLIQAEQTGAIAPTPKLSAAGLGASELKRIATRLGATAAFELSLFRPGTRPFFSYRMPDGSYIPFDQASPGQQANALLTLLFGQAVGPLLIDQPEDDLDNATALQIAESIWSAKEKRQLIIASHNPNLLVIGDAELILHCSHFMPPKPGVQVGISEAGGIDTKDIRNAVAAVMEGGEDAFRLRMNRYGY
jgi:chromosome segregation protein